MNAYLSAFKDFPVQQIKEEKIVAEQNRIKEAKSKGEKVTKDDGNSLFDVMGWTNPATGEPPKTTRGPSKLDERIAKAKLKKEGRSL